MQNALPFVAVAQLTVNNRTPFSSRQSAQRTAPCSVSRCFTVTAWGMIQQRLLDDSSSTRMQLNELFSGILSQVFVTCSLKQCKAHLLPGTWTGTLLWPEANSSLKVSIFSMASADSIKTCSRSVYWVHASKAAQYNVDVLIQRKRTGRVSRSATFSRTNLTDKRYITMAMWHAQQTGITDVR